jgi:predicted porin
VSNSNTLSKRATTIRRAVGAALIGSAGLLCAGSALAEQSGDGSFTFNGITLYGTVDIGLQYVSNGAPVSDYFPAGGTGLLQKNSRETVFGLNPSNLGQSKFGIKGSEPLFGDWSGIFRLESFFNPQSGDISDALRSVAANNGKTAANQSTGVDSSIAGQFFGSAAYVGMSSPTMGTWTFGRQNGLMADGIAKYDPQGASNSFSVIGYSGTAAGGGDTENRRLDNSLKYVGQFGAARIGAQYQFNGTSGGVGSAIELQAGFDVAGLSLDAYYEKKYDAISVGALSAAQLEDIAAVCAGTATAAQKAAYFCTSTGTALTGTISDNTSYALMGSYSFPAKTKVFAGYEHISFANPNNTLQPGQGTIGGYVLATTNNAAYANNKVLQVTWAGVKVPVNSKLEITAAYYRYDQNAYGTGANVGCSSDKSGTCSGTEQAFSIVADWRLSKRFDMYAGAMYSSVADGLANGYYVDPSGSKITSTIDPTIGVRFTF